MPLYTSAANTSQTGYKNLIHNGAMAICQRDPNRAQTAGLAMTSASGSQRFIDRWVVAGTSGAWSVSQGGSSFPPGFNTALQFTCTTAVTTPSATSYWIAETDIEGYDAYQLAYGTAGKTVTLSFWATATGVGNNVVLGGSVRCSYAGAWRSYGFTYTVATAGVWQRFTVVVPGDSVASMTHDSTAQMSVIFAAAAGSNFMAPINGTWVTGNYITGAGATGNVMGAANAALMVTGVQLELGGTATAFEYRSRQVELALCQRYLYIVGNLDASGVAGIPLTEYGIAAAQNYGFVPARFPVQMRAAPTFTFSSLASLTATDRITNYVLVSLAYQVVSGTPEVSNAFGDLTFGINGFTMTTRSPIMIYTAASGIAWLQFSAEL